MLPSQVHFPLGNLLVSSRSIRWSQCAQEIYRGKPNVVVYPGSSQVIFEDFGGLPLHGARANYHSCAARDLCNHHPARNQLGRAAVPHSSRSGSPGHPDQWPCNRKLKLEVPPIKTMKNLRESPQNFGFNGPVPHFRVLKFPAEDQCGQESNFHSMENTLKFAPYCPPHYLAVLQGYPSFSHTPTFVSSIRIGAGYLCQSKLPAMNHLTCSFGYVGRHPQVVASLHFLTFDFDVFLTENKLKLTSCGQASRPTGSQMFGRSSRLLYCNCIQTFFYKPTWSLCSIIFISDAYWSTARHLSAHLKLAIYGPVELFKYRHGWFLMIDKPHMGMNQYLLYHIFCEWASGFQLFDRLLIGVKGRHYPYL